MNSRSPRLFRAVHRLDYLMSKTGLLKNSSDNMLPAYCLRQTNFSTQGRPFLTSFNPTPMPGSQRRGSLDRKTEETRLIETRA
jgi:hypothetical protein